MNAIKCMCIALLLAAVPQILSAQYVVRGRITDKDSEPLAGAGIVVRGLPGVGAMADADGEYSLEIPDNGPHTVVVSFMGFMTQSRVVRPEGSRSGGDPENLRSGQSENLRAELTENFSLEENPMTIDQVVVTGTRTPKTLMETPIVTRVISGLDISRSDASNIQDLLISELPGIEFSYSMDQQVNVNLQGFGGSSVLFLIDGERIAGETLDNIDYNRLNLDNIERIEIVKGGASSLYGSNAVGGVVNLITKEQSEPWSVDVSARYGAHNEQRYDASAGFSAGKVTNVLNAQMTGIDTYDVGGQGDFSTVYGNKVLSVKDRLVYNPTDRLRLTGRIGYYQRQRDADVIVKDRYRDLNAGLKAKYDIGESGDAELSWSYDEYNKSDFMANTGDDVLNYSNVQHTVRALFNWRFGETGTLTAGGDFMNDYLRSYQFEDGGHYSQVTADCFAQFDWNVFRGFNVIGALRYDFFSAKKLSSLSPKLGLMYRLDAGKAGSFTFRGSYAKGFRAPTLKEMYMSFDMAGIFMIYGNPDLLSEVSHNFTLSAEYFKKYWNVTLTGYFSMVRNGITTVWNEELNSMRYANEVPSNVTGADMTFSMRLPCGFGAKVAYTYSYEYTLDGSPTMSTTRPHSLTARIEYGREWKNYGFNLALSGRYLSRLTTNVYASTDFETLSEITYPGYTIWKLVFTQDIWRGISLNLIVDNLFNYRPDYYYNNSPVTVGTTFAAGLALSIGEMFRK